MLPFIELNGKEYNDSSFIMRDLKKILGNDPNQQLNNEQKGASRAFEQMLEASALW